MTGSRCMIDCITTANTTTTLAFHGCSFSSWDTSRCGPVFEYGVCSAWHCLTKGTTDIQIFLNHYRGRMDHVIKPIFSLALNTSIVSVNTHSSDESRGRFQTL